MYRSMVTVANAFPDGIAMELDFVVEGLFLLLFELRRNNSELSLQGGRNDLGIVVNVCFKNTPALFE